MSLQFDGNETGNLTGLLQRMQAGDKQAEEKAVGLVYEELHRIASRELRRERADHLLQTTALINEAYARLAGSKKTQIQNRGHFFAIASQQMRRILVDYARARDTQRRGGGAVNLDINDLQVGSAPKDIDLLLLDESLEKLNKIDPRAARVVELRFFGGYGDLEVVEALGVSLATVRRDWEFARAWLASRMNDAKSKAHSSNI